MAAAQLLPAPGAGEALHRAQPLAGLEADREQACYQIEVLKREVARLAGESSALRQDLLREADARAGAERAHYQATKQLEAQLAAAQFAREQAAQRLAGVERENEGLRQKAASLLSIGQQCGAGTAALEPLSKITVSKPLECKPAPAAQARTSRGAISLIKAADQRILALEADLKRREGEVQGVEQQLQRAQEELGHRDAEIQRLSSQLGSSGPDVDRLAWQYRNEANEAVILQLNQQVEALTQELTDLQRRAVDRGVLEAAEEARRQAEARAQAVEREREGIAVEVEEMQNALARLQQEAGAETQARLRLGKVRGALEEVKSQKTQLEGQLTHAETKVSDLRERLEQKEAALRRTQQRCKQLEAELKQRGAQPAEGTSAAGDAEADAPNNAVELEGRCEALQSQLAEAEQLRSQAAAERAAAQRERDLLQDRLQYVSDELAVAQQQLAEVAAVQALRTGGTGTDQPGPAGGNAAAAGETNPLSHAAGPASAARERELQQQLAALAAQLEQLEFERAELRVKLEESESQVDALVSSARKLTDAAQQQQLPGLAVEKGPGAEGGSSGEEWRLAAGHPAADVGTQAELQEAQAALHVARQQEEALRQHVLQLKERCAEVEARSAELQADLAAARASAGDAATAAAAVGELRQQLEERNKEVADLSAISLKADSTIQQYMTQLKHMATELRATELRLEDAEGEPRRRADAEHRHAVELAELRCVVGALDAERDALQAELDRKAEAAAAQAETAAAEQQRLQGTERALAATEARLAASTARMQESEQEIQQLQGQAGMLSQHLGALEAEYEALRDEFRAVTDDLEAMVKENQVVSNQLCATTQERDELAEQARLAATRAAYHEQLLRAREGDLGDVRTAYEGLAHENQRLQAAVMQLQRELAARDSELAIRADEVASLREAQRGAQSQINQYIADLQAYERQFDSLSRAMHRSDNVAEGLDQERQALLDQLRAAEQVRFQLERAREGLQRQLAHAEGSVGVLQARLGDAQADTEALRQRVGLEQARVGELEGLLAMARAEQFNSDAALAASGAERQIASLREQKGLLEEQVATMQRQIDGLVQRREAQEQEIAQLRMGLAVQHDAGSAGREAQQKNTALVQQLAELQGCCKAFAAEAEGLRAQVARLEGAREGAEGGLAAAQRELEQLRSALRDPGQDGQEAIPAHIHARLFELEGQNERLQRELAALEQGAGQSGRAAADVQSQLREVQEENDRLLDLLGRMDAERAQLQREKAALVGEVVELRAAAPEEGAAGPGPEGGGDESASGHLRQQLAALKGRLAEEQAKRHEAEASFHELLESLDVLRSPGSAPSPAAASSGGPGVGSAPPVAAAVSGLQATLQALEADNGAVQGSLQRTRQAMSGVQSELNRVRTGTGAAGGSPAQQQQPTHSVP